MVRDGRGTTVRSGGGLLWTVITVGLYREYGLKG
jgi:hypothetical protein